MAGLLPDDLPTEFPSARLVASSRVLFVGLQICGGMGRRGRWCCRGRRRILPCGWLGAQHPGLTPEVPSFRFPAFECRAQNIATAHCHDRWRWNCDAPWRFPTRSHAQLSPAYKHCGLCRRLTSRASRSALTNDRGPPTPCAPLLRAANELLWRPSSVHTHTHVCNPSETPTPSLYSSYPRRAVFHSGPYMHGHIAHIFHTVPNPPSTEVPLPTHALRLLHRVSTPA